MALSKMRRELIAKRREMREAARHILDRGYREWENAMISRHLSGPTGPTSVSVRTGRLRSSLRKVGPTLKGNVVEVGGRLGVGSTDVQGRARIHEFGGIIRPKRARMLAIPTRRARTAAGVARVRSPRQVPGLFVIRSRGRVLLARKTGVLGRKTPGGGVAGRRAGRGTLEIMYVLVPQVRMPARLNARKEWRHMSSRARSKLKNEARRIFGGRR